MNALNISRTVAAALSSAFLLASITATAQAEQVKMTSSTAKSLSTQHIITTTVTVTAVDQKARTVTVKGADGGETTMAVSDEVKRLNEVKVGDQLNIGYLQAVELELRPASMEELKDPLKETVQSDRADNSHGPAGAELRTVRAVVTVEGASRWLETLTVKGPRGNYFVLTVDPGTVKWDQLCIGQTLVGTYTEALVMSIDPAKKKK